MRTSGYARDYVFEERLAEHFEALSKITATPGRGITRLAFTEYDAAARDLAIGWMRDAGLEVRTDAALNIIGRTAGRPEGPVIMTGSHIDSVPQGGNFDGAVGVVAAIEAARAIASAGIKTALPIEVVCFASEEAPRFSQAGHRFGSRVMGGVFDPALADKLVDDDGVSLAEALRNAGGNPDLLHTATRGPQDIAAMLEMHIEQGDALREFDAAVGVVTCITGTTRFLVIVEGEAAHSGGTPMMRRRDALTAAAQMVLAVEDTARDQGGTVVATVGTIAAEPGSISVVPGRACFGVDVRDIDGLAKSAAVASIRRAISNIAATRDVTFTFTEIRDDPPVVCAPSVQDALRHVAEASSTPYAVVASHTGHDAASLDAITDVGMLFVRNRSGKSHSPDEDVAVSDIAAGARVLADALVELSSRAG